MRQSRKKMDPKTIKTIITGVLVGIITLMATVGVGALAISKGIIGEKGYTLCALFALFISAMAAAWYASKTRGQNFLLTGLIIALTLIVIRMIFMFGSPQTGRPLNVLAADMCILLGALIGGLPKASHHKRRHQ